MDIVMIVGENDAAPYQEKLDALSPGRFLAAALPCGDWNRDLSPWPAPAAFKKGGAFAGEASSFLPALIGAAEKAGEELASPPAHRIVAGYSLAGLFALWTLTQTPLFDCAACASPSLWFPGWTGWLRARPMLPIRPRVALSLGDREEKTRNPVLAAVGEGVRGTRDLLLSRGVHCSLRMDPGGHFEDAENRTVQTILDLFRAEESPS